VADKNSNAEPDSPDKPPTTYGAVARSAAKHDTADSQQWPSATYPEAQSFAPNPGWPYIPAYPPVYMYQPPNFSYQQPPQQPSQQNQQQQVVVIEGGVQKVDGQHPPPTFCCHIFFSCCVFWLINPLFGLISFILASEFVIFF
jgi:hypothetical protein